MEKLLEKNSAIPGTGDSEAGSNGRQDLFPAAPPLSADPDLLYRAFLNILLNALQAMPEGGTLSLTVRHQPQEVEVEISDTGSGLSPEALEKAFDPFFTTKEKGSGLGLAIVKNTIEAHQGRIRLENGVRGGVAVRIVLPRATTGPEGPFMNGKAERYSKYETCTKVQNPNVQDKTFRIMKFGHRMGLIWKRY